MRDISLDQKQVNTQLAPTADSNVQKNISVVSPFATDSIVSATVATDKTSKVASVRETLNSAVSWLCGLIYGQSSTIEQPNGRPILEAPKAQDEKSRQSFVKEITEMQKRIIDLDEEYKELLNGSSQNQEALLMKLLTLAIKNQLNIKEQGGLSSAKKVHTHTGEKQDLNKSHQKIKDELATAENRALWAGRANTAATVVAGALALALMSSVVAAPFVAALVPGLTAAGLQAMILTGGVAKFGAASAIVNAGTTLASGYVSGAAEIAKKEDILVQAQKDLAQDGIKIGYDDLKKSFQDVSAIWALLRETAERHNQASSAMLR